MIEAPVLGLAWALILSVVAAVVDPYTEPPKADLLHERSIARHNEADRGLRDFVYCVGMVRKNLEDYLAGHEHYGMRRTEIVADLAACERTHVSPYLAPGPAEMP